jgi:2'-5' RNA ligase
MNSMYFIAILAPEAINRQALKWKLWMQEKFNCEAALKSPAHITLIPPFWMHHKLEHELFLTIQEFTTASKGFNLELRHFGCFKPKVIFIDVMKNQELEILQQNLARVLTTPGKFPILKEDRLFQPHVTIATRDLYKKAFYEAWDYFSANEYEAQWFADSISLLRHNKKNWDVMATSRFGQK